MSSDDSLGVLSSMLVLGAIVTYSLGPIWLAGSAVLIAGYLLAIGVLVWLPPLVIHLAMTAACRRAALEVKDDGVPSLQIPPSSRVERRHAQPSRVKTCVPAPSDRLASHCGARIARLATDLSNRSHQSENGRPAEPQQ